MQSKDNYVQNTVENFIYLLVEEKINKEDLLTKINNSSSNKDLVEKAIQRVGFAYKRINEPLEDSIKYMLLLFPFGIVNIFNLSGFFSLEENKRLGYVKKVKEYYKYSFIGLILYVIIIILAIIFF